MPCSPAAALLTGRRAGNRSEVRASPRGGDRPQEITGRPEGSLRVCDGRGDGAHVPTPVAQL